MSVRKPQFVGERVQLGEIVRASSKRNRNQLCNAVFSVTNSRGFVPSSEYFSKEVFSKDLKTYRIVEHGMIAYNPSRINVGSVALQDVDDQVVVSPLYVVFSVNDERVLPAYIVCFLKSRPGLDQIAFQSIGTVRNNLKFDALCRMEIPLPSLIDQQKVVGTLGAIEEQIDVRHKVLDMLHSLVKSRFVEMFGSVQHECKALLDCCDYAAGGATPSMKHEEYYGGKIPFIKSGDVKGDIADRGALTLTEAALQSGGAKLIPRDSVLVVTRSALLKRRLHVALAPNPVVINQDIKAFHPRDGILSSYLMWAIRSCEAELLHGVRSVNTSSIKTSDLFSLDIPLPSLALQQEFADFVAQVDKPRFVAPILRERIVICGRNSPANWASPKTSSTTSFWGCKPL